MTNHAQQLLWSIIQCPCITCHQPACPCNNIVNFQDDQVNPNIWHCPEPWVGKIEETNLLFVLSNPGYDSRDYYPIVNHVPSFVSPPINGIWQNVDVEDFFEHRFDSLRNTYVQRLAPRKILRPFPNGAQPTWLMLCKYAFGILYGNGNLSTILAVNTGACYSICTKNIFSVPKNNGQFTILPGTDFAITEVVKCKSNKQIGVQQAQGNCFQHFANTIDLFLQSQQSTTEKLLPHKTIVACGKIAQPSVQQYLQNNAFVSNNNVLQIGSYIYGGQITTISVNQYTNGTLTVDVINLPHPVGRFSRMTINGVLIKN